MDIVFGSYGGDEGLEVALGGPLKKTVIFIEDCASTYPDAKPCCGSPHMNPESRVTAAKTGRAEIALHSSRYDEEKELHEKDETHWQDWDLNHSFVGLWHHYKPYFKKSGKTALRSRFKIGINKYGESTELWKHLTHTLPQRAHIPCTVSSCP